MLAGITVRAHAACRSKGALYADQIRHPPCCFPAEHQRAGLETFWKQAAATSGKRSGT